MSRVIKFRVWIPTKEWGPAYMYPDDSGRLGALKWGDTPPEYAIRCSHPVPIVHGPGCGSSQAIGEMTLDGRTVLIAGDVHKEAVLEQFTGLLDCDGKEIYENDILLDKREEYAIKWDDYSLVVWESNGWRLRGSKQNELGWMGGHWTKNSRVVGNAHQHAHLLS